MLKTSYPKSTLKTTSKVLTSTSDVASKKERDLLKSIYTYCCLEDGFKAAVEFYKQNNHEQIS